MTGRFTAPTHLPFNLHCYLFLLYFLCFWLHLYRRPPPNISINLLLRNKFFWGHSKLFPLSLRLPLQTCPPSPSFPFCLALTPATVSKVLMGSYPTLHCLIRCCWVSKFPAPISRGQLNAILCWISPCNLVSRPPAGANSCVPTVDWPLDPYTYNILYYVAPSCQTAHSVYRTSMFGLHIEVFILNNPANSVAVLGIFVF